MKGDGMIACGVGERADAGAAAARGGAAASAVSRVVGSAFFLACSWTWCLGMFFPVYLVHDFGVPGWIAFAVPNCVGAASVGFVFRRRGASEAFVARHGRAMRWFSIATIVFHSAFLSFVLAIIFGSMDGVRQGYAGSLAAAALVLCAAVLGCGWWGGDSWRGGLCSRSWRVLAVVVFALSVGFGVMAERTTGGRGMEWPAWSGAKPAWGLACMAPFLVVGFLTCPHLDLTFHRVCRELGAVGGRAGSGESAARAPTAFVVGFFALFPVLIGLTLLYAGPVASRVVSYYVIGHLAVQSVFTMGAHFRELRDDLHDEDFGAEGSLERSRSAGERRVWGTLGLCALGLCAGPLPFLGDAPAFFGSERTAYELFMSLYGLVFPAYVLVVVLGGRGPGGNREVGGQRSSEASRRRLVGIMAVVIVIAAPMAWLGYVEQRYAWLLPCLCVLMAGWALARRGVRGTAGGAGAEGAGA